MAALLRVIGLNLPDVCARQELHEHNNDDARVPSPADYDEELDEEQGVRGTAVLPCHT